MRLSKSVVALSSLLAIGSAVLFTVPASAMVACNHDGDCWRTGSKVQYSGVILSFHDDSWWDEHKSDAQFHWHDADTDHRWEHGYWKGGNWVGGY
ncbi:MAG TPA: hypothetical protein VNU69_05005 [Rhizomicrobium sp.]|jgi:hypothetical protein|nr:hypothetical protein [Rhizomicrobium sp.]